MKLIKKASLMILGISLLLAKPVFADVPKTDIISWEYNQQNKTWKAYRDGALQKSWLYWNGYWYYLDILNGEMKTSWLQLADGSRYFLSNKPGASEGQMLKGWHWIGGYCYYFSESAGKDEGKLMTNTLIEGRYRVDASGRWIDEAGAAYYQNITKTENTISKGISAGSGGSIRRGAGGSGGGSSRGGSGGGSGSVSGGIAKTSQSDFGSSFAISGELSGVENRQEKPVKAEEMEKPQDSIQETDNIQEEQTEKPPIESEEAEQIIEKGEADKVVEQGEVEKSLETEPTHEADKTVEESKAVGESEADKVAEQSEPEQDESGTTSDNTTPDTTEAEQPEDSPADGNKEDTQAQDTSEALDKESDKPDTGESEPATEAGLKQETENEEDTTTPQQPDGTELQPPEATETQPAVTIEKNDNISTYTTETGEKRSILWVKGVEPLAMGANGIFTKEVTGSYVEYILPYTKNQAWYDVNKNTIGSLQDLNLCFAAVSSNMLHWWMEQNGQYIEKYLTMGAESRKDAASELQNLERYVDSFASQQSSRIFDMFKYYYGYRKDGYVSTILLDWFINGYTPSKTGAINRENPDFVPDKRLGFFYPVFKEKLLTRKMFSGNYESFSDLVKDTLESGQIMGVEHHFSLYGTTHIITLWGAEFDDAGKLRAIYVTDSDDNSREEEIGMKRYAITKDSSGYPRLNNNTAGNSYGARLEYVHTLDLGTAYWEAYFKEVE